MSPAGTKAAKSAVTQPEAADTVIFEGGKPLVGEVSVRGAKNLVTKAMVAALLADTPSTLKGVPAISDVAVVRGLLEAHAVTVSEDVDGELVLDPRGVKSAHFAEIDAHAGSSRIPILFCGPLLHQLGEAFIPDLGGCRIGDRPINFHLDALRAFGAELEKSYEGIRLKAPQRLVGAKVDLPYPSVGATEQVLLTAVRAKGVTELTNAAIEPEIIDLIAILQKMGAIIVVEPNRTIVIEGVESLQGYDHRAIADRNEAASWAAAALATRGDIYVRGAKQQDLMTFLNVYRKVGGLFDIDDEGIRFRHPGGSINPVVIETDVHPGFMTDWQQPMVVALTQAEGRSIIHETVYENRFGFTDALVQMGANIEVYKEGIASITRRVPRRPLEQAAVIAGPTPLRGANIRVPDLRGGFSHVIAAVTAQGTSEVSNIGIISRGYEHLLQKLDGLGVSFELGA
jgi:UDP-N-acetylglucosamine 1-carboxyvinyltransferase